MFQKKTDELLDDMPNSFGISGFDEQGKDQ